MGSGSGRGLVWGGCATQVPRGCWLSRNELPPARNGRRMRGSGRGAGRRKLTGASMTLRPTGPRGPCSRSRGPTTWRTKASIWRCRRLARAAAPVVGRPVPFPQGGRKRVRFRPELPAFTQAQYPCTRRERPSNGLLTMLPAGEWWRPRDARRPRPARGRIPSVLGVARLQTQMKVAA